MGTSAQNRTDCSKLLALKLFCHLNDRISTGILSKGHRTSVDCIHLGKFALFNSLRHAFIFGIDQIVACLVEVEGCNIKQKDSMGYTSLARAAWNGHEAVVELPVNRAQIDLDKPSEDGQAPLMLAACDGGD